MKIVTIVGARPQFIKSSPVSKAIREKGITEYLVHTGQHYDYSMSKVFFDELNTPSPDINLNIGSGSQAYQTGQMLIGIEAVLTAQKPDCVLVFGDTNSTLAGALASVKLHMPVAHVESGLRSYNRLMPEEHNRILTDHCSDFLFCPTQTGVDNLAREGIKERVYLVGDTMYDAVLQFAEIARHSSKIISNLGVHPKQYLLVTVHRSYNTDNPENLSAILCALQEVSEPIIFPIHPRTRQRMNSFGLFNTNLKSSSIRFIDPLSYLDMIYLEQNARIILTDSGGIQKEAYFFSVPCVTLRFETEWVETVQSGWNILVGTDKKLLKYAINDHVWPSSMSEPVFGNGNASQLIAEILENNM